MSYDRLQRMYGEASYYWGREPNEFAERTFSFLPESAGCAGLRAVDIGCGEGRDAVYFAECGLETLAVDIAPNGLDKVARLARERDVEVRISQGDVNTLRLAGPFDLVYSIGTIQYLTPENREEQFEHFKRQTVPGGVNALFAFVENTGLPPAPDLMADEYLYAPGELPGYYSGWECLHSRNFVFDDNSGGIPHQHAAEEYVLKKPRDPIP